MSNLKITYLLLVSFFLFYVYPGNAAPVPAKERMLLQENFKKLVPARFSDKDVERLKSNYFPVEILKNIVQPKNWIISSWGLPDSLKMTSSDDGWRIIAKKDVNIYSSYVDNECSDFSLDITLRGGDVPSTVVIGIMQYDLLHQYKVIPLRTESFSAGEIKKIHLPIHFAAINPGIRVEFKITGDVTFQDLKMNYFPLDLAEKGYSCVEGTLEACSAIPDPKKSDYSDCRFTSHLKVKNIYAGLPCHPNVQLVIDGFRKYQLLGTKTLKAGDLVRCTIIPFEKLPEKFKSTQQADDLDLFQLESYYVVKIETCKIFSESNIIPFKGPAEKHVSVFERQINPPISPVLEKAQQSVIAEDLKHINAMLAGWDQKKIQETNAAFQKAWIAEKAKDNPGRNRLKLENNTYIWRNINNSYWELPEYYKLIFAQSPIISPQNVNALVAFRDFLHANGCQFIISLVPDLYEISARIINQKFQNVPDFLTVLAVQQLQKNGIETIYASREIIKNYNRYPFAFFYQANEHPSDTCQDILSSLTAERLKRFQFTPNYDPRLFSIIQQDHVYSNDPRYFFPASCDIGNNQPRKPYQCRCVLYNGKEIMPDPSSPILVIGNSFMQTPMDYPDSFTTLLASKLRRSIDTYRVGSMGPFLTMVQKMFNNPEKLLKNKKVIIMQVGVCHLSSNIKFRNIREMDQSAQIMTGKQFLNSISIKGNTKKQVAFAKNLYQAKLFSIPASGKELIQEFEISGNKKENILIIPVCAPEGSFSNILVNGQIFPIPERLYNFAWDKILVRISSTEKQIKVELKGNPGTVIAIGDIQIYQ